MPHRATWERHSCTGGKGVSRLEPLLDSHRKGREGQNEELSIGYFEYFQVTSSCTGGP